MVVVSSGISGAQTFIFNVLRILADTTDIHFAVIIL